MNWIFTFGCGQKHEGHYVKISGTAEEAREKMFAKYGAEWCFQYSEEEWKELVDKYGADRMEKELNGADV